MFVLFVFVFVKGFRKILITKEIIQFIIFLRLLQSGHRRFLGSSPSHHRMDSLESADTVLTFVFRLLSWSLLLLSEESHSGCWGSSSIDGWDWNRWWCNTLSKKINTKQEDPDDKADQNDNIDQLFSEFLPLQRKANAVMQVVQHNEVPSENRFSQNNVTII